MNQNKIERVFVLLPAKQVLLDDPDNGPCREQHRRCRAVVKKVEAGAELLSVGDVAGATEAWRAATALEPDNPALLGPLLLRVRGVGEREGEGEGERD